MADRAALEAAASAGVITQEQVATLHDFLKAREAQETPPPAEGEESLRFIRNFHDVFLAIGILLFALGLAIGIGVYATEAKSAVLSVGALSAGAAAVMWGLGELFARRRRLFLPAIAIVLSLSGFVVVSVATLYVGALLHNDFEWRMSLEGAPPQVRIGILLALGAGVAAPGLFYARFRLPFSLGLTGAAVAVFVIGAALLFGLPAAHMAPMMLGLGALLFLAGVAFDARDPARATRFSDNGFWLHFAAAPLILNGAFGLVGGVGDFKGDGAGPAVGPALATLVVVVLLGLVSLLINRRALIVSALLTTGVAIGVILNAVGLGAGALAASTLIVLGAFVLILGAGWRTARGALLGRVKPEGFWARVFPPEQ